MKVHIVIFAIHQGHCHLGFIFILRFIRERRFILPFRFIKPNIFQNTLIFRFMLVGLIFVIKLLGLSLSFILRLRITILVYHVYRTIEFINSNTN